MAKSLVLYLGVHKTATTTIQSMLEEASPQLAQSGTNYIPLHEMRRNVTPVLSDLAGKGPVKFFKAINEKVSRCLLLSDENLLGKSNDPTYGMLYPFAEARILALLSAFSGYDKHIILAVRNPVKFLPSLYCEYIRHYSYHTCASYLSGFPVEHFSWMSVLGWLPQLRAQGVKVSILPFEEEYGGGLLRILQQIETGIGQTITPAIVKRNTSIRRRASYSAEEIHAFDQLLAASNPATVNVLINALKGKDGFGSTQFDPLSEQVSEELLRRYRTDLALL